MAAQTKNRPLLTLISQQIAAMQMMQKQPKRLVIDHDSLEVLWRETDYCIGDRIYGLQIETSWTPNVEVCE